MFYYNDFCEQWHPESPDAEFDFESDEFKEDLALAELMKEADRSKKVKRSTIMKKLHAGI